MNIKIYLDDAESDPIVRLAEVLQIKPEDVAYAALNRRMLHVRDDVVQHEILAIRQSRSNNLPLWADSAGSVHNYEGMAPCYPEKSKYSV